MVQLTPLVHQDSVQGMLFRTFDSKLMMVLHRPRIDELLYAAKEDQFASAEYRLSATWGRRYNQKDVSQAPLSRLASVRQVPA